MFKVKGNISINSTKEDVSQFLFDNFRISKKVYENIIKENITGEILIYLEDDDYTFLEINPKVKEKIKEYLESNKKKLIVKSIKLPLKFESNKNEVINFFEKYLSFKGNLNDNINGKKLLTFSEQDMKKIGLNLGQRKKLLHYIKHLNMYYKEELKKFFKKLKKKLAIQNINKILRSSNLEIYKEEKSESFIYKLKYSKQAPKEIKFVEIDFNQIKELKNIIFISSTKTNLLKEEGKDDKINKEQLINQFLILIDNINQLINSLDNLIKAGYPHLSNITLKIENSIVFDPNNREKDLQKIIDEYKRKNEDFRENVKKGYEKYPLLRLFYGKQFIKLYEKAKNNKDNISHIVNSMTFNKIKNFNVAFQYDDSKDSIENIHKYLENLFGINNNLTLDDIYSQNKILSDLTLDPGLYRIITTEEDFELNINISYVYINLTGNLPIINTLLICNDETNIEIINSFLYRAIFCEAPILFLITNIECLELSIKQNLVKTLNDLYLSKNRNIKSYILFLFKKDDSKLMEDIEQFIPFKNMLNNFLIKPEKSISLFNETESYSSAFAGYGKTTEIKYKVKEKNGKYYYLPLGGVFTRNYVINNLENLNLELKDGKKIFIHLDLSETDNDDLMNELLFKLLILRFIDSKDKIFYLGNDVNIIIEIPNGYIDFKRKYGILTLFKNIYIDKLCPLRLEENIHKIEDSPISIVAETLKLYEDEKIGTKNIILEQDIKLKANECEQIINRHFKVENHNYYQKINFIKILAIQFKKFCKNMFFNYNIALACGKSDLIGHIRKFIIKYFIFLAEVFARSPYDSILKKKNETVKFFDKTQKRKIKEEALISLSNEMKEVFSFELIKHGLVVFNRDGFSISIISNFQDKNNPEYKELLKLWNSQNYNPDDVYELIDYKNLSHEHFIKEIKNLFSLHDYMSIEDIKEICEKNENYIFDSDNYIKMIRIVLSIEAKIPVILMGETGEEKTKFLEILAILYGKGKVEWKTLQMHAGISDKNIVDFIDEINNKVKEKEKGEEEEEEEEEKVKKLTWIFLDEINKCNSLGLITEIMCNHSYLGKKISKNIILIAGCIPYRLLTKKMRESDLVNYNIKEDNKLNNLVYTVNPLPHSLLNFVFDIDSPRH